MLKKAILISALLLYPDVVTAQVTYYFPHVINGYISSNRNRYVTEFFIMNPSATVPVDIKIRLYNKTGSPLNAFADARFNPFSTWSFKLGPRAVTLFNTVARTDAELGWAKVEATGELNVSTVLQEVTPSSVLKSVVTIPSNELVTRFSAQAHVNTFGNVGMAILNPSSEAAAVTVELFSDLDAQRPVATRTITIAPQNNVAAFLDSDEYLNNLLPRNSTGQLFNGVMQVTSSRPISAALVFIKDGGWLYWPILGSN
jgi:hypothetical protein